MKATELIQLALKGYKVQDIKDLLALAEEDEQVQDDNPVHDDDQNSATDGGVDENGHEADEADTDDTDYKALYEAEQKKVKELQRKAQHEEVVNTEPESDEDAIRGLVTRFFS